MKRHLAIFTPAVAQQILSGKKTIETRFSKHKIAPFGLVEVGDLVYIKISGASIIGQFWVQKVLSFQGLTQKDWELIKTHYGKDLSLGSIEMDESFFKQKSDAIFGTLIFISRVERFLTSPIKIEKKDRRGWIVLD
jgi:predicted transcriptional regulator